MNINDTYLYSKLEDFIKKAYEIYITSLKTIPMYEKNEFSFIISDSTPPEKQYQVIQKLFEYPHYERYLNEISHQIWNIDSFMEILGYLQKKSIFEDCPNLIQRLLIEYIKFNQKQAFDKKKFLKVYYDFECALYGKSSKFKLLTFLPNIDISKKEIKIDDTKKIIKLNNKNLDILLKHSKEKEYVKSIIELKGACFLEEYINLELDLKMDSELFSDLNDFTNDFFDVLKLFKSGDTFRINTILVPLNPFLSFKVFTTYERMMISDLKAKYHLDSNATKELITLFNQYLINKSHLISFIDISLGRYLISWFKKKDEDKLLDLIIAFESVYLTNNPEISFRLGYYTAHFIGTTPNEKLEIYNKIREAYDTRSAIVHGTKFNETKKKEFKKNLPLLIDILRDYYRKTFKKLLTNNLIDKNKDLFYEFLNKIIFGI